LLTQRSVHAIHKPQVSLPKATIAQGNKTPIIRLLTEFIPSHFNNSTDSHNTKLGPGANILARRLGREAQPGYPNIV